VEVFLAEEHAAETGGDLGMLDAADVEATIEAAKLRKVRAWRNAARPNSSGAWLTHDTHPHHLSLKHYTAHAHAAPPTAAPCSSSRRHTHHGAKRLKHADHACPSCNNATGERNQAPGSLSQRQRAPRRSRDAEGQGPSRERRNRQGAWHRRKRRRWRWRGDGAADEDQIGGGDQDR